MAQTLNHLRFPLAALAVVVISACGKAPEATMAPAAAKVSVAKVLEQPVKSMSGMNSPGVWKHRKPSRSALGFPVRSTQ